MLRSINPPDQPRFWIVALVPVRGDFQDHAPVYPDAYDEKLNGRKDSATTIRAAAEELVMQLGSPAHSSRQWHQKSCQATATDLFAPTSSGILALVAEKVLALGCAGDRSLVLLYQAARLRVATVHPNRLRLRKH